jgi:hypothetical protein
MCVSGLAAHTHIAAVVLEAGYGREVVVEVLIGLQFLRVVVLVVEAQEEQMRIKLVVFQQL